MKVKLKVNAIIDGKAIRSGTIMDRSELPAWLHKKRYVEQMEGVVNSEPRRILRRRSSIEDEEGP